jgi:hypothetical protein
MNGRKFLKPDTETLANFGITQSKKLKVIIRIVRYFQNKIILIHITVSYCLLNVLKIKRKDSVCTKKMIRFMVKKKKI